jgi:hypothetical protein
MTVPTGEPALRFLKLCADEFHTHALAPRTQVHIERCGHDDDRIALALVPPNALKRAFANDAWNYFRRVSAPGLPNRVCNLALEANSGNDWPGLMCRNQAESVTNDNWTQGKREQDDSMPAHCETEEA